MVHRLFLGMPLPEETALLLHEWAQASLPAWVRLVPLENLHVTLAFFGDRSESELQELEAVVRRIEWPGVQVSTGRLCMLGRGAVVVELLHGELEATALSQVGLALGKLSPDAPGSDRGRRLHVTVGRSRRRPNPAAVAQPPGITMTLGRLHLYASTLTPSGAHYKVVASAR